MKLIPITLLVIICSSITGFTFSITQPDKTRLLSNKQVEQWRADIDFLQQALARRHINLYHTINAGFFKRELTRIKQQLTSLTETSLAIELMRLIQRVGDGHTQFAYQGTEYHRYPLELRLFDKELRVIGIVRQHKQLLGAKLVAIEGATIERLHELTSPILQGVENIYSAQQRFTETIIVAEILHGLKISPNLQQASFTFKLSNGDEFSIKLKSFSSRQFNNQDMDFLMKPALTQFTHSKISIEGLDLYLGNDNQIAYLDFHHYSDFAAMQDFSEDLIALLRAKNTKEVIIDLRNNGGGDFFVGLQLAWALIMVDNLNWRDGLYVLTSRKTFSAAMSNAVQYRQLLNATLVGEPTGANPVGYQDAGNFKLPNSGWNVMYSKRLYKFQETSTPGVQPDILLAPDWELFRQGKDNQLEWVLEDIRKRNKG
ncbi:S41 family peptidase [Cellvibrio mixtus]|uniref:S41 family peptidase n=1 Tax=Cellvibrio mixtus TaxID=39650 RepID=UPI0005866476|nr:S41 family peptidase [Cellvibrio mixtus]